MNTAIQPKTELTIPDPIKGGNITFSLAFTFESIARAEEIADRGLLVGLTRKDIDRPTISLVRTMLYGALLPNEPNITFHEAAAFVTKASIRTIWGKVLDAWVLAMEEKSESAANPTTGQS